MDKVVSEKAAAMAGRRKSTWKKQLHSKKKKEKGVQRATAKLSLGSAIWPIDALDWMPLNSGCQ
jgi:hypothetical protein